LGKRTGPVLVSELEWIESNDTLYIAAPIHEGLVYPIRVDTLMNLYFYCENELFTCSSVVISRYIKDNLPMLNIRATSSLEKIQRRQYYRFQHTLTVEYKIVETPSSETNEPIPFYKGITRDIGGGGVSILVMEKAELENLVECRLNISEEKQVSFFGNVVRVTKLKNEEKYNYNIGVSFSKIENRDREEIIKFIFQQQRKLINKGLI
jgi:c-di-GMP-binding flagellar brake protein YcgR